MRNVYLLLFVLRINVCCAMDIEDLDDAMCHDLISYFRHTSASSLEEDSRGVLEKVLAQEMEAFLGHVGFMDSCGFPYVVDMQDAHDISLGFFDAKKDYPYPTCLIVSGSGNAYNFGMALPNKTILNKESWSALDRIIDKKDTPLGKALLLLFYAHKGYFFPCGAIIKTLLAECDFGSLREAIIWR